MKSRTVSGWTKTTENPPEGYKKAFDKEKEFLLKNVPKNTIVLDVGCGYGRVMKLLALRVKKIIGIDNDKKAVKDAKEYLKEFDNVEVFFEDAEKMHFEDKSFDVVLCVGATPVNFGETKKQIYSEIRRVLKDKGLFLTSVYNEDALEDRLITYRNYYEGDFEIKENGTVIFGEFVSEQYTKEQIMKILEENGFQVLKLITEGIFHIIKAKEKIK